MINTNKIGGLIVKILPSGAINKQEGFQLKPTQLNKPCSKMVN